MERLAILLRITIEAAGITLFTLHAFNKGRPTIP